MRRLRHAELPSFSLVEMLVVLVISGILLGSLYFAYYTVTAYQLALTKKLSHLEDVNGLYFSLKRDVDRGEAIQSTATRDLRCQFAGQTVQYTFTADYCLRRQTTRIDTFHCKASTPIISWQGKVLEPADTLQILDALQVTLTDFDPPLTMQIHKLYDAASLIKLTQPDTLRERN
jgi:prepilin-type N-terminal cleavage/methylation domain-containing protein